MSFPVRPSVVVSLRRLLRLCLARPERCLALFVLLLMLAASVRLWRVQASGVNRTPNARERVAAPPQYQIFDLGVVQAGDTASQGFGVSAGGVAVGRSFRTGATQAFSWTQSGGLVALPNLAGRSFAVANSANDAGLVVGTGATTAFGSGRLPLVWQNGAVSQLPLPAGETLGDANDINAAGVVAGSVNGGSLQRGAVYSNGSATVITQTTANGSFLVTAFGINDAGRIVGQGIDPTNAARNVGFVYDLGAGAAIEVGALPGFNGALAFGVSNSGFVTGASMLNQGSGLPFIWSSAGGIVAVPLPDGTSQGTGRAVNSAGWVVGNASSAFSIPFLWDGTATYRLQDIIPANSGWDLSMNTSASALGISENNIIVGTGVFNGATHGYAMIPAATPTPTPTPTPTVASIQFSAATLTADEATGRAILTVTRSGNTANAATVDYASSDGTARQRTDYTLTAGTLSFAAGETSKTFAVPLADDFYVEGGETLTLTLSNPNGGTLGTPAGATLTITDNDTTAPADRLFFATLSSAQEVPVNSSTATGSGTVQLNAAETQITVNMSFSGLSSAQTAAHIHGAAPVGVNAPVLFNFGTGQITNLNFAVTPAQVAQLKAGLFYFNIHTSNFAGGEIRGQVLANPIESARYFVRQQYHDFLSRVPDQAGEDFWTGQITTTAGTDLNALKQRRVAVSNAFFFEQEYQSTGAFVYRLYRAAYGNTQPFANPMGDQDSNPYCTANPNNCQLIRAAHVPAYENFASDRARLNASQLAASQLALATSFVQRTEFISRYSTRQTAEMFVDALISNIQAADGANLTDQRANLIALHNNGGRGAVLFRLAEDNQSGNPINNRAFIDAEYNRAFVTTQYFGYLRRDADMPGLNFWLSVVNQFPLRSAAGQNGMVCAFITSGEYQQRFNSYTVRTNQTDCP